MQSLQMSSLQPLRLGAVQVAVEAGNTAANIEKTAQMIDLCGSRGVRVAVFPELSLTGYDADIIRNEPQRCTIEPEGALLNPIRDACRRNKVVAVVGACVQRGAGLGNSAIVIDREGKTCASYDKQYLDGQEKDMFRRGEKGCLIEVDKWPLALGICYDASFPEHARAAARAGAAAYLVPGAFIMGDSNHRRSIYFAARALENTFYVVFANFAGAHGGMIFCGQSAVYGPDGRVISSADTDQPGVAIADLDTAKLAETRASMQMLNDCSSEPANFTTFVAR